MKGRCDKISRRKGEGGREGGRERVRGEVGREGDGW